MMKFARTLLLLAFHLVLTDARRKRHRRILHYKDCGTDPNRPIRVVDMSVRPLPVRSPGKVKVSAIVNITGVLPQQIDADISITKYFFGIPFKIGCYNNVGTCSYKDICSILTAYTGSGRCPRMLRKRKLPCRCPFREGLYSLQTLRFTVPPLEGMLSMFAKGKYDILARIHSGSESPPRELGCLQFSFRIKHRRKSGWFFHR